MLLHCHHQRAADATVLAARSAHYRNEPWSAVERYATLIFAEVRVDQQLGVVRVTRIVNTVAAAVAVLGAATLIFAFSSSLALSLAALLVLGASDMVNVNIRSSLVQLATPDVMRVRVSAVDMLFIGASSELGAFESGLAAALLGAVPAVALGGLGTLPHRSGFG